MGKALGNFLGGLAQKKCAVIGMGVSNIPLIRMLLNCGARVLVCDKKTDHDDATVQEFKNLGAAFSFGEDMWERKFPQHRWTLHAAQGAALHRV